MWKSSYLPPQFWVANLRSSSHSYQGDKNEELNWNTTILVILALKLLSNSEPLQLKDINARLVADSIITVTDTIMYGCWRIRLYLHDVNRCDSRRWLLKCRTCVVLYILPLTCSQIEYQKLDIGFSPNCKDLNPVTKQKTILRASSMCFFFFFFLLFVRFCFHLLSLTYRAKKSDFFIRANFGF